MRRHRYYVAHTLTGRYTFKIKRSSNSLKSIGYTYRQFQGFIIKGVNMYLQK